MDSLVLTESKLTKRRKRQSCREDYSSCDVANKKSKSDDIDADILRAQVGDEHNASAVIVEDSEENRSVLIDAAEMRRNEVPQDKDQRAQIPAKEEGLCTGTQNAIMAGNKDFSMTTSIGWGSNDATSMSSENDCNTAMEDCENKFKIGHDSRRDCLDKSVSADGCGVTRYSTWDYDSIKLPNMAGEASTEMVLESPPEHLLPPGVKLSKPSYIINIKDYRKPSKLKVTNNQGTVLQVTTVQPNAKNWAEYKRLLRMESEAQTLLSSPAGILWTGDVTPLIKPWQATSTCKLLIVVMVTVIVNRYACILLEV